MIRVERVIDWMNIIRSSDGIIQERILENFWESQLKSKFWLIAEIKKQNLPIFGNVYVFGGWYGILSQLLVDNFPKIEKVYSIDIDEQCEKYGKLLSNHDNKIFFITSDMKNFRNYENASLIINTSTEHISQEIFDSWINNLPKNTPITLQGNDFFNLEEHVRCSENLNSFKEKNKLKTIIYEGSIFCPGDFNRFMTIGYV